jgi:hypothetical protein
MPCSPQWRVRASSLTPNKFHCSDNTMDFAEAVEWQTHFGLRVVLWAAVLRV